MDLEDGPMLAAVVLKPIGDKKLTRFFTTFVCYLHFVPFLDFFEINLYIHRKFHTVCLLISSTSLQTSQNLEFCNFLELLKMAKKLKVAND